MLRIVLPERGTDEWGCGDFGAPRGSRTHMGIDYECYPGAKVLSPVEGLVTKLGYPYGDDLSYRYVEVTAEDLSRHRIFYVSPLVRLGDNVRKDTVIGLCQNIQERYTSTMKNHVHYEILMPDSVPKNPKEYYVEFS